jgi:hypothetical protein
MENRRGLGEFGWIHAIACPSGDELWVGEPLRGRVLELVVNGSERMPR